jgi:hypothetical protein
MRRYSRGGGPVSTPVAFRAYSPDCGSIETADHTELEGERAAELAGGSIHTRISLDSTDGSQISPCATKDDYHGARRRRNRRYFGIATFEDAESPVCAYVGPEKSDAGIAGVGASVHHVLPATRRWPCGTGRLDGGDGYKRCISNGWIGQRARGRICRTDSFEEGAIIRT